MEEEFGQSTREGLWPLRSLSAKPQCQPAGKVVGTGRTEGALALVMAQRPEPNWGLSHLSPSYLTPPHSRAGGSHRQPGKGTECQVETSQSKRGGEGREYPEVALLPSCWDLRLPWDPNLGAAPGSTLRPWGPDGGGGAPRLGAYW